MTEEEAKKKWCPKSMEIMWTDRYGNCFDQPVVTNSEGVCRASDCMMWREDLTREEASLGHQAASGHCGLGGLV